MSAINYDLKKIKGFVFDVDGVLSPSTIPMDEKGVPVRMVNIKDGYALQLAIKKGFKIAIITGGNTESVVRRYNALGINDVYIGASVKISILEKWIDDNDLSPEEILYMGDDIPDLICLRHVGLPAAPRDAATEVLETADYISPFTGGYGCVRDVVEQVLKAHNLWMKDSVAFGW